MAFSIFFGGNPRRGDGDAPDDRLVELFSNRLELKKAFSTLRAERAELADALARAESETATMRRRLEYLEDLLTEPQSAVSAMLFYHLRGLWRRCHKRLQNLSADLSRQMAGRRQVMAAEQWQSDQRRRLAEVSALLAAQETAIQETKDRLARRETERSDAKRLWQVFLRRRLDDERARLAQRLKQQLIEHSTTLDHERQLNQARPPELDTLPVADLRLVNLHVLALAQFLHAHFADYGLVERASVAFHKQVGTIDFGDDDDCREIMRKSDAAFRSLISLERGPEFRRHLHRQVELLRSHATYGNERMVVPEPFQSITSEGASMIVSEHFSQPSDVLGADIWTISQAFVT